MAEGRSSVAQCGRALVSAAPTGVTSGSAAVRRRQPRDVVASTSRILMAPSAPSCAARRRVMALRPAVPQVSMRTAVLMQLAFDAGVPSPKVLHVLKPDDDLGTGFIMQRVAGETIPRKILRDDEFADARPQTCPAMRRDPCRDPRTVRCKPAAASPHECRSRNRRICSASIDGFGWPRAGVPAGAALAARSRSRPVRARHFGAW